jgi:hypothetical protein
MNELKNKLIEIDKQIIGKTKTEKDHNFLIILEALKLNDKNFNYHIRCLLNQENLEATRKTLLQTTKECAEKEFKRILKENDLLYQLEGYLSVASDGKYKDKSEELSIFNEKRMKHLEELKQTIDFCLEELKK